jgi:hypothetical protein
VVVPVFAVLMLSAVPANIDAFDEPPFGPRFHSHNRALITSAVRVPYARDVSPQATPVTGPFSSDNLDMGFLLYAERAGKLEPSTGPLTPALANELAVRLNLTQRPGGDVTGLVGRTNLLEVLALCTSVPASENLRPGRGTLYLWDGAEGSIRMRPVTEGRPDPGPAVVVAARQGTLLVSQNEGWEFDWEPEEGRALELCRIG